MKITENVDSIDQKTLIVECYITKPTSGFIPRDIALLCSKNEEHINFFDNEPV